MADDAERVWHDLLTTALRDTPGRAILRLAVMCGAATEDERAEYEELMRKDAEYARGVRAWLEAQRRPTPKKSGGKRPVRDGDGRAATGS